MENLFELKPLVIAALHLPRYGLANPGMSTAYLEDYTLSNMAVFAEGGIPAVYIQDGTPTVGAARDETVAVMSALGRIVKKEFPKVHLGIILSAHDATAPIAIAYASGADFVRIKVFVGAMLKAEGIQQGCGFEADQYRRSLQRENIQILADVHDRMGMPLLDVPIEQAAQWAARTGANALVLTGASYPESLQFLQTVREANLRKPLLLGGGANSENISEVLQYADGVIISSSLKRKGAQPGELLQWDREKIIQFMDAVRINTPI